MAFAEPMWRDIVPIERALELARPMGWDRDSHDPHKMTMIELVCEMRRHCDCNEREKYVGVRSILAHRFPNRGNE
jgi:hypothetical protein